MSSLMATHPPIVDRINRLRPADRRAAPRPADDGRAGQGRLSQTVEWVRCLWFNMAGRCRGREDLDAPR